MASKRVPQNQIVIGTSETDSRWNYRTLIVVLLAFWAAWWSIVFLTNFFDGLIQLNVLSESWTFASGNHDFVVFLTEVHDTPSTLASLIFATGVLWELIIAVLMWNAVYAGLTNKLTLAAVYQAFIPAIGFFAAVLIFTEVFIAYDLASTHVRLFIATLLSIYVIDRLARH